MISHMGCKPGCQCGRHIHVVTTSYTKTCAECSAEFTAKYQNRKYCSAKCRLTAYTRDNGDKIRQTKAAYARTHRDERRAWTTANTARVNERRRWLYAASQSDPDKAERRRIANRLYYQENAEKLRADARNRRQSSTRSNARKSQHGTDWEPLFESLLVSQDGKCYLCGTELDRDTPRAIHLDHDHACCGPEKTCGKCRRGLCCKRCNLIIGWAKDDVALLRRIADNLERQISYSAA